jgi:dolichyl-diphosphooligosaccharide--protein glycosyltransferase
VIKSETRKLIVDNKVVRRVISILLFFICIAANVYFRLFPAYLPILKQEAKIRVENKIWDDAVVKVKSLYPRYNLYAQKKIVEELFKKEIENKDEFNKKVEEEYKKEKDRFQNEKSQTYLLGVDSYQWMRNTENVLHYGHPGTEIRNGEVYDTYMLAPYGAKIGYVRFQFYSTAFLYRIFTFFLHNFSLQKFLFYIPLLYTLIFLTFVYIIARKLFSNIGAFFTILFIGLNEIFLKRSCAGWYDYDVLSILMATIVVWFVFLSLRNKSNIKKLILYSILASFFEAVYVFTWIGWWFIFLVIGLFFVLQILNNYSLYYKELKRANRENLPYFISGIVFLSGSIIFSFLLVRINIFEEIFVNVKMNLHLGTSLLSSIWPNIYYTVDELKFGGIGRIVSTLHGGIVFSFSLLSMLWMYISERRGENKDFVYIMFLWFIFMLFASLKGIRFVFYLCLPLGFFLGASLNKLYHFVKGLHTTLNKKRYAFFCLITAYFFILSSFFISASNFKQYFPFMNDRWMRALIYLKDNTPQEAIINSWWDFGNFFKAVSKRRVIFDGQSQNRPIAYWMAKVLITSREEEALSILKMLNNSSDTTYPLINKYIKDPFRSIQVLKRLLALGKEEGRELLKKEDVPLQVIDEIIRRLYKIPPPAYFVVDKSMLHKMNSISFIGNWDFIKLYVYRNLNKPKEEVLNSIVRIFGLTLKEAEKYYQEIVITPGGKSIYESLSTRYLIYGEPMEGRREGNFIYFDNGLVYDLNLKKALFYSSYRKKYQKPKRLVISQKEKREDIKIDSKDYSNRGVWVFKVGDKYKALLLDERLLNSVYSRLYFLKGGLLKHFEPFYMDEEGGIYIYKIVWEVKDE